MSFQFNWCCLVSSQKILNFEKSCTRRHCIQQSGGEANDTFTPTPTPMPEQGNGIPSRTRSWVDDETAHCKVLCCLLVEMA